MHTCPAGRAAAGGAVFGCIAGKRSCDWSLSACLLQIAQGIFEARHLGRALRCISPACCAGCAENVEGKAAHMHMHVVHVTAASPARLCWETCS